VTEDAFTEHRALLFTIAYEMLGSATDAEDVLQESYLRWSAVDRATVKHPRAYLVRLVTRQALNQLRAVKARRVDYVGTWLPEPIRTASDISDDAILAESVSMAMMLVLETLNSTERAVFVLHDVFGYTHGEISASIGKTEVTVRQIAHRARAHVHARRRRFDPDSDVTRGIVQRFLHAAATGAVQELMDLLAPDVVQISDGGGKVVAARRPVTGRDEVARFVLGVSRTTTPTGCARWTEETGHGNHDRRTRHRRTHRRGVRVADHDHQLHGLTVGGALPPHPARRRRALRRRRDPQSPLAHRLVPRTHHPLRAAAHDRVHRRTKPATGPP
jgi:RNA polymerase sigma-70 factor (ECF subfamily)